MLENSDYEYLDKDIEKRFIELQNNDKIFGAFMFGSRFHGDYRKNSDYDIALFTDLDFFDIAEIEDNLNENSNIKFDISDICELPINIQEEVMFEVNNVIFLKNNFVFNWINHMEYLKDEIRFKKSVVGDDIYGY